MHYPLRLAAVFCLAMLAAAAPAVATPTDNALMQRVEQLLAEESAAAGFSGGVLIARGDEVLLERAYGLAERDRGTPNRSETRFNLASVGKMFTAVAVLQLVEQGKLELDAPVGRYLPDYPSAVVREQVTLRHLLNHQSGLGSYWGPEYLQRRRELRSVADHLPLFDRRDPDFIPGTRFQYSNAGFMLLGRLVEVASGEDYYDYVARHVFAPAGMEDTGYYDAQGQADHVATGYTCAGTMPGPVPMNAAGPAPACDLQSNDGLRELRGGPAGGGYATVRDLWRFERALSGGHLLGAAMTAQLLAPTAVPGGGAPLPAGVPGMPAPAFRGLGVEAAAVGDDVGFGHGGASRGSFAELRALRDAGLSVAIVGNLDGLRAMRTTLRLYALLAEAGWPDFRAMLPMAPRRPG